MIDKICLFICICLSITTHLNAQNAGFDLNLSSDVLHHIAGNPVNSDYLYVTAGSRLYCIGNQAGTFPKVGFHVPGQMGGVWQQPVKLLDGFRLNIKNAVTGEIYTMNCDSFISCSFVTKLKYQSKGRSLKMTQTQFVPDNLPVLVVEYTLQNTSDKSMNLDLELNADVNLMPVWLGERSGMMDEKDTLDHVDNAKSIVYFRDKVNTWYAGIGFDNPRVHFKGLKKTMYNDKGITGVTSIRCVIQARKSYCYRFYVSGSISGITEIENTITTVRSQLSQLYKEKKQRYSDIDNTAEIIIPDKKLEKAYTWGKYSTDWLIREVPGMGRGMSAGLPDYPWFFSNDQATTFMALTGTRSPDLFYDSFKMLKKVSNIANDSCGRIIHEVSTNGVVYDKGRMEESQLHIIAAWQIFNWTGNLDFLKENYVFAKKTWTWLQQHDTNHNGYIEGFGGAEIEGLNDEMLDVQVNTFKFLEILSKMAYIFNDDSDAAIYQQKSNALKEQINKDWWIDSENRYADFITSKEKALKIIDDALTKRVRKGRNDWAGIKLESLKKQVLDNTYPYKGYVVYYNPSGYQPMEEGMTDTLRAKQMLKSASFFTNKYGGYITGIERPDTITLDERKFQKDTVFTYNRAVMPGVTAGLAQAAVRFGMTDTALMYVHKTINSFGFATPGTIYEVAPDYGMFVQAWNVTGINIPLIQYFFGVSPEAYKKEISIRIQMPTAWKYATLKNLMVGNNRLTIEYKKNNNLITCRILSTMTGWKIHFIVDKSVRDVVINNNLVTPVGQQVEFSGTDTAVQFKLPR